MSHRTPLLIVLAIPSIAVLAVPFAWAVFYFGVYLGYGNDKVWGQQEFATNGVSQIKPAMEMDQLFADCRHFITYGANSVPLFTSEAYFGDRYVLTMQVAVDVKTSSSGVIVGEPEFYLNEVSAVTVSPSGQVGTSFSRSFQFGAAKWQQVYDSGGDFNTVGFNINTTPVSNFRKYAEACRPSNQNDITN